MRFGRVPRYYFLVRDEWGEAPDDEGVELPDLDAAREYAIAGARSMMSDSVRRGILNLTASIDILDGDGDGEVKLQLVFKDAIEIRE